MKYLQKNLILLRFVKYGTLKYKQKTKRVYLSVLYIAITETFFMCPFFYSQSLYEIKIIGVPRVIS